MGRAKDAKMEHDELVHTAQSILAEIGAIEPCEGHEHIYFDQEMDNEELYAKATNIYKKRFNETNFDDFHEAIRIVLDDCSDECGLCANNMKD